MVVKYLYARILFCYGLHTGMMSIFKENAFDREKHVFPYFDFSEIMKDMVRFFSGTPVLRLPPVRFHGCGVYALYYIGESSYYKPLYELNRTAFAQPIYVGKAVPRGWRQSKTADGISEKTELCSRLKQHAISVEAVKNLRLEDFYCRFMILESGVESLIAPVEAALIREYTPVWNSCLDGFGNHDPGVGRYNQAKSDWDVLHPGRSWAERCTGVHCPVEEIEARVQKYLRND